MDQHQHSSSRINIKKAFIIVYNCFHVYNFCAATMSCRVKAAFQKKEDRRGAGNCSFNLRGYISEKEWGYLPVSAEMRRALVCVSPLGY